MRTVNNLNNNTYIFQIKKHGIGISNGHVFFLRMSFP